MIKPEEHIPLSEHTTFKIGGPARYFFRVKTVEEAREALALALKIEQAMRSSEFGMRNKKQKKR
ncbi:MAG: hypothetical protein AAB511_02045 [Patescibacteria group bacterium]